MSAALRPIPAPADLSALESHAYTLFCHAAEETAREPRRLARLTGAVDPARIETQKRGSREARPSLLASVPLAHQLWLSHLLWLEEVIHTIECRAAELTAAELAGLQAVARARARFLREHRICPHCDAVNPRFARGGRCRRCHQEL
ncbi:MAG: hypothetical protein ACRD4U_12355 [Candidatus Acidiferrales bacterium]